MNVLLIGNFLSGSTGSRSVSEDLAIRLESLDWGVITTSPHTGRIMRMFDMISTIVTRRKDYAVASVEVYSGVAFIWAEIVCEFLRILNKPYLLNLHGGNLPSFALKWPNRVHRLLSNANIVTTPSLYVRQDLQKYLDNIHYLPNAIELEHYHFKLRNIPSPRLCWLRAFHHIYNPLLAVEVVSILRETFPTINLTMIGPDKADGSMRTIQTMIRKEGLSQHINIIGPVAKQKVPYWLNRSDVYLNTTRIESFGIAVMEAGAMGLPIVTTNVGELPYIWTDEETALLVPSNDSSSMAHAIVRILTESSLAGRLSCQARQKAEKYDWSVILPEWQKLFNQL